VTGRRLAVFGLARSGLAIAKAALAKGAHPAIYEQKPAEKLNQSILAEAQALGIPLNLAWDGKFEEDLIVTSPGVPKLHPKLQNALQSGKEVISEVEFAYRISEAPIVAITGTNGKSTTTVMTMLALRGAGEDAILCGNIFGSGYEEIPLTEAALNSTKDQVLVAEISSFQLEWVKEFRPAAAGITTIAPDHLDRYEDFNEYAATKHRIFSAQTEEDYAVVRAHDSMVKPPKDPTVLTFGATSDDARVQDDGLYLFGEKASWNELPIHEPHNRSNAAMACMLAYGLLQWKAKQDPEGKAAQTLQEAEEAWLNARKRSVFGTREGGTATRPRVVPRGVIEGLKNFKGLAHRMEKVGTKNNIQVINNSMCTNPDAVLKSAMSLREPKHLLLGGTNKKLDFKPLKAYLSNSQNRAYLFGKDAEEVNSQLGGAFPIFETMAQAFGAATQAAKPGEVIMLAPGCASQDQFEDFRDRGNVFREIATEWLNG
jgi:UDP-N-acetylmuramoylalanine--D-glutamate ligase